MTDYLQLALTYGGFTSLDKVYLSCRLRGLSHEDKLALLTPPPSVLNAYFAELYQKQGPEAATTYYVELSYHFNLLTPCPSFEEVNPFVRLNLSGKAYGFAYVNRSEEAVVFAEQEVLPLSEVIWELAKLFPHYQIYEENHQVKMAPKPDLGKDISDDTPDWALLSQVTICENGRFISSYNQEELEALVAGCSGQVSYAYDQRRYLAYIKE